MEDIHSDSKRACYLIAVGRKSNMKNSTLMVLLSSLSMSVVACAQVEDTPTVDPDSALVVQEPPNDYSGFVILRLSPDLAEALRREALSSSSGETETDCLLQTGHRFAP